MILALAGRRIDPAGAEHPAFPSANAAAVQDRIAQLLEAQHVRVLVCSAACGADLLALTAADRLGVRRRVILPFEPSRFRETSVTDRPGDWGADFDEVVAAAEAAHDLLTLGLEVTEESYVEANRIILKETLRLAAELDDDAGVALVWDGKPKGSTDHTVQLATAAQEHGLAVFNVNTL